MILELWINPTIGLQSGNNDCNWSSFYSGGKIIHSRDVLFMGLNFAVRVATVLIITDVIMKTAILRKERVSGNP